MSLDILVTPKLTAKERALIAEAADRLGIDREKAVRLAVKNYIAACIPGNGTRSK